MLPNDVRETIVEILTEARASAMKGTRFLSENNRNKAAHIDAALAALDASVGEGALDCPDSIGWWAFEGRWRWNHDGIHFRVAWEVLEERQRFCIVCQPPHVPLPIEFTIGKWTRLYLPWTAATRASRTNGGK